MIVLEKKYLMTYSRFFQERGASLCSDMPNPVSIRLSPARGQGHWSRTVTAKPILRKAIIAAWPKRHAAMQAHRKLGPWKAGATERINAVIAKIEWLAARTQRAR